MTQSRSATAVIDRLLTDVLEGGDLDALPSLVHDDVHVSDVAYDGAYEGIDAYRGHLEMMREAFDDIETSMTVLAECADTVTVEYHFTGTHQGPFMGFEATGNEVSFAGIDVFTVEGGKIARLRGAFDQFSLLSEIGVVSLPEN